MNYGSGRKRGQPRTGGAGAPPAKRPRPTPGPGQHRRPASPGTADPPPPPVPSPHPPVDPNSDDDPIVVSGIGPRAHESWRVVPVRGGWLRFSPTQLRLDAHCGQHGLACKLDKVLSKCSVGNQLAWLAHKCGSKAEHDTFKAAVGTVALKPMRVARREAFVRLAAASGGWPKEILDAEFAASGLRDEPDTLRK